ncbi:Uncharacterised protein [Chlamydia trachomatis]|nr:Uncharacterised protein [Chlamydia trachomatis]
MTSFTCDKSTPNDFNKSPDPEDEVEAFPPCLHTGKPIPAATMADDVETLNVFWPSPPVPTISMYPLESTNSGGMVLAKCNTVVTAAAI